MIFWQLNILQWRENFWYNYFINHNKKTTILLLSQNPLLKPTIITNFLSAAYKYFQAILWPFYTKTFVVIIFHAIIKFIIFRQESFVPCVFSPPKMVNFFRHFFCGLVKQITGVLQIINDLSLIIYLGFDQK